MSKANNIGAVIGGLAIGAIAAVTGIHYIPLALHIDERIHILSRCDSS